MLSQLVGSYRLLRFPFAFLIISLGPISICIQLELIQNTNDSTCSWYYNSTDSTTQPTRVRFTHPNILNFFSLYMLRAGSLSIDGREHLCLVEPKAEQSVEPFDATLWRLLSLHHGHLPFDAERHAQRHRLLGTPDASPNFHFWHFWVERPFWMILGYFFEFSQFFRFNEEEFQYFQPHHPHVHHESQIQEQVSWIHISVVQFDKL